MYRTVLSRTIAVILSLGSLSTVVPAQALRPASPDAEVPFFTNAPSGVVGDENFYQPPDLSAFWNPAVQHPAQKLFGLGDAVLLRQAAALQLRSRRQQSTAANIDSLLQKIHQDPVARWQFAPFLLRIAFGALYYEGPNPDHIAFRRAFEQYMSFAEYKIAQATRKSWRQFSGQDPTYGPAPTYQAGPTMGNTLPKYAKVSEFQKGQNGSMGIGQNGRYTIQLVLAPSVASKLPDFKDKAFTDLGADINATAAAVGLGVGVGQSAATLTVVSAAILGYTIAVPSTAAIVAAGGPVTSIVAVTPALLASGSVGISMSFSFMTGVGVGVAIACAALLAMVFADVIKSQEYDKVLNDAVRAGPIPVDVFSLVNPKFEQQAGLWYPVCRSGNKGVATFCYQNCPTGFRDDGLYCGKPGDYGRGGGYAIWDKAICERDNPQGCEQIGAIHYPKCKGGFHNVGSNVCSADCPKGWEDIGVSCKKPLYGRGVGQVGDPTNSVRTANRVIVFSYLTKMLIGDPADSGVLTLAHPTTTP